MKKTEFRTPLLQSAAVLVGVIILFAIVSSSGASSAGGGVLAIFFGIGNFILFLIGMGIALLLSIAILIAIFLAAVAMVDPEQASLMYSGLKKKNFKLSGTLLNKQCCENNTPEIGIAKEEYDRMNQEIEKLYDINLLLQGNLKDLTSDNTLLQGKVVNLNSETKVLQDKIEGLNVAVESLQSSEKEINDLVEKLAEKIQAGTEQDLKKQIEVLEKLHSDTRIEIATLMERLQTVETSLKQNSTSGILTYIEKEEDQAIFTQTVEEAVAEGMTYAQINKFLSKNLSPELDKILKKHPALTKKFIRNLR